MSMRPYITLVFSIIIMAIPVMLVIGLARVKPLYQYPVDGITVLLVMMSLTSVIGGILLYLSIVRIREENRTSP
jgi:hypothetical protein